MGAAGRRWIAAHLGMDAVLGRIEQDLRGLIRTHRGGPHPAAAPEDPVPAPVTSRLARRLTQTAT